MRVDSDIPRDQVREDAVQCMLLGIRYPRRDSTSILVHILCVRVNARNMGGQQYNTQSFTLATVLLPLPSTRLSLVSLGCSAGFHSRFLQRTRVLASHRMFQS